MKKLQRCILLCITMTMVLMTVIFSAPQVQAESSIPVMGVRIGVLQQQGYATKNEDGTYTGADVEYIYKIAQYANFKIEIQLFESTTEAINALDNGEIDGMCNVIKTSDREEKYLFTEHEIGQQPLGIFVRKDDDRYSYQDLDEISNMKIGAEQASKVQDSFKDWCLQHGYQNNVTQYSSLYEIEKAMDAKEIDAFVYGSSLMNGYRTLGTFSPQPYYIAMLKKNTAVKNKIDDAMNAILSEDPLFENKLVNKYTNQIEYEMEPLTKTEKQFILAKPTVNVAVLANDQPYYAKNKQGEAEGVIPDLYAKIAALTGLSFKYQEYTSEEDAVKAVLSGSADILAMYSSGQISAYNTGLRVTTPYADVDAVLITHSGVSADAISKVAVKKRTITAVQNDVDANIKAEYIGYSSGSESFEALKKGEVDGMICGQPTANWLINQSSVSAYNITTIASGALEITGALAYDNSTLCSILSKAVNSTNYSFNELVTNNTLPSNDFLATVSRVSPVVMFFVSGSLVALMIALIWAMTLLIKHQKEKDTVMQMKAENDRRQIELSAAEKQAEDKNRFFSNISHDMRTPLNAIIGFSDLASEQAASPVTQEYLAKIKTSGQLLNELINDTLTVSKVNSGKTVLHPKPTPTKEIYDAVYYPIQDMAKKKNISFKMDRFGSEYRTILVDPLNLEKILLNLLTNAVKYTNRGGHVEMRVNVIPDGTNTPETIFVVEDNGIGISEEFLPHIYDAFAQEDNTGRESSGTGLGLSIVKNLVDIMGGTIEVESKKNAGTKFTVHFHFEQLPDQPAETAPQNDSYDLSGKRMLLCEDNTLNREIATELLQKNGIFMDTAVNGQEGLKKFEQSKENYYDAVLMDIRMPIMNGLEAARAIRSLDRKDAMTVPIIAMTANAFEDDIQECLKAGMNAHIAKPIDPDVMFRTIGQNIKN